MRDYLFVLLGAVIISGIAGALSPEGEIKKYVALLLCVCVLSVTVRPLGEIFANIGNAEQELFENSFEENDYKNVYNEYLLEANSENFSKLLAEKISRELNIPEEQIGISADMYVNDGEYLLKGITVELYGMGVTQEPERIKSYVYKLFGVECEIAYY